MNRFLPFVACLLFLTPLLHASPLNDGRALLQEHRFAEALPLLLDAHDSMPYDESIRSSVADAYYGHGLVLLEEGRFRQAAELLRDAQDVVDGDGRIWYLRGVALFRLGAYDEAEVDLAEAQALLDDPQPVRALLARIYYDTGRLAEAEELYAELAEADTSYLTLLEKVRRERAVEEGMDVDSADLFEIRFDDEINPDISDLVLDMLSDAHTEQGSLFSHYLGSRLQVIIYQPADYTGAIGMPPWSAAAFDGKIRIPLPPEQTSGPYLRALIYHEFSHALVHEISRGRAPAWLLEGLAEVFERSVYDRPSPHRRQALALQAAVPFDSIAVSFRALSDQERLIAYEKSYSFVDDLLQQFGWHTMYDLLRAYGTGLDTEAAFAMVFKGYGLDFAQLERDWSQRIN